MQFSLNWPPWADLVIESPQQACLNHIQAIKMIYFQNLQRSKFVRTFFLQFSVKINQIGGKIFFFKLNFMNFVKIILPSPPKGNQYLDCWCWVTYIYSCINDISSHNILCKPAFKTFNFWGQLMSLPSYQSLSKSDVVISFHQSF